MPEYSTYSEPTKIRDKERNVTTNSRVNRDDTRADVMHKQSGTRHNSSMQNDEDYDDDPPQDVKFKTKEFLPAENLHYHSKSTNLSERSNRASSPVSYFDPKSKSNNRRTQFDRSVDADDYNDERNVETNIASNNTRSSKLKDVSSCRSDQRITNCRTDNVEQSCDVTRIPFGESPKVAIDKANNSFDLPFTEIGSGSHWPSGADKRSVVRDTANGLIDPKKQPGTK